LFWTGKRSPGRRALVAGALTAALGLAGCTSSPAPVPPFPSTSPPAPDVVNGAGAPGYGDPFVPSAGNGGYDVTHYQLALRYDPGTRILNGTAVITATATAGLSRFDLDLRGLTANSVSIDGQEARAQANGDELVITPKTPLAAGHPFVTTVVYGGTPEPYDVPGLGETGFLATSDGAFAVGEPQVAASWFPVNDHPRDKATYAVTITVPDGLDALSNGILDGTISLAGRTTWTWHESAPMAPYLATVVIGHYRYHQSVHDGKPVIIAVAPSLPQSVDATLARTPEIVDYLASKFGPYPFDALGGIAISDQRINFALENQTRPVYSSAFFRNGAPGTLVVVHEEAHQWFGDSVSLHDWRDVWLNEGFATYAEWLWTADHGGPSTQQAFDTAYSTSPQIMWQTPPGNPPTDDLFSDHTGGTVYTRGAMTRSSRSCGRGHSSAPATRVRRTSSSRWPNSSRARACIRCSRRGSTAPSAPTARSPRSFAPPSLH
jgi:aminopeptidase N